MAVTVCVRLLSSILWHVMGNLRWATNILSSLGFEFRIFLLNAAQGSYQQVLVRRALEGKPVAQFMQPNVVTVLR